MDRQSKEIDAVAPGLGLKLLSFEVTGVDDVDRAFTAMTKERAGVAFSEWGRSRKFRTAHC